MKILSLEEIEKWETLVKKYDNSCLDYLTFNDLLRAIATARAYHDLKSKSGPEDGFSICRRCKIDSNIRFGDCPKCGQRKDVDDSPEESYKEFNANEHKLYKLDDKPHAPTIKAVIEAIEVGGEFTKDIASDKLIFNHIEAKKYLEAILKEL